MSKLRKAFLPKWMGWFAQLFVWPMWLYVTYREFWADSDQRLGIVGWAAVSIVLVAMSVMLLLMAYRKLPVYLILEEEE